MFRTFTVFETIFSPGDQYLYKSMEVFLILFFLQMPQSFMTEVLRVHTHFSTLINDRFNNNKLFLSALDRACNTFVNYSDDNKPTRGPELVSVQYSCQVISLYDMYRPAALNLCYFYLFPLFFYFRCTLSRSKF